MKLLLPIGLVMLFGFVGFRFGEATGAGEERAAKLAAIQRCKAYWSSPVKGYEPAECIRLSGN